MESINLGGTFFTAGFGPNARQVLQAQANEIIRGLNTSVDFKVNAGSLQGVARGAAQVGQALEQQRERIAQSIKALEQQGQTGTREYQRLTKALGELERQMAGVAKASEDSGRRQKTAFEQGQQAALKQQEYLNRLRGQYQTAEVDKLARAANQLRSEWQAGNATAAQTSQRLQQLKNDAKALAQGYAEGSREATRLAQAQANAQRTLDSIGNRATPGGLRSSVSAAIEDAVRSATAGIPVLNQYTSNLEAVRPAGLAAAAGLGLVVAGAAAAVAGLNSASSAAGRFETQLTDAKITTQASADELNKLDQLAKNLGPSLAFGPTSAAAAFAELGTQGVGAADILEGAGEATLTLGRAIGDTIQAANIGGQALTVFGLRGQDLGRVSDIVANAVNTTALKARDFNEFIGAGGAAARAAGIDFATYTAIISAVRPAFSSAQDAGTSFKTFVASLTPTSKEAAGAMREIGFSAFDAEGRLKPINTVIEELREKMRGLSQQRQLELIKTIFGSDASRFVQTLVSSNTNIDQLAQNLGKAGAAADQAKTRLDTLQGSIDARNAAFEKLGITIGEKVNPFLRDFNNFIADIINQTANGINVTFRFQQQRQEDTANNEKKEANNIAQFGQAGGTQISKLEREIRQLNAVNTQLEAAEGQFKRLGFINAVRDQSGRVVATTIEQARSQVERNNQRINQLDAEIQRIKAQSGQPGFGGPSTTPDPKPDPKPTPTAPPRPVLGSQAVLAEANRIARAVVALQDSTDAALIASTNRVADAFKKNYSDAYEAALEAARNAQQARTEAERKAEQARAEAEARAEQAAELRRRQALDAFKRSIERESNLDKLRATIAQQNARAQNATDEKIFQDAVARREAAERRLEQLESRNRQQAEQRQRQLDEAERRRQRGLTDNLRERVGSASDQQLRTSLERARREAQSQNQIVQEAANQRVKIINDEIERRDRLTREKLDRQTREQQDAATRKLNAALQGASDGQLQARLEAERKLNTSANEEVRKGAAERVRIIEAELKRRAELATQRRNDAAADTTERLAQVEEQGREAQGERAQSELDAAADTAERLAIEEEQARIRQGEEAQKALDDQREADQARLDEAADLQERLADLEEQARIRQGEEAQQRLEAEADAAQALAEAEEEARVEQGRLAQEALDASRSAQQAELDAAADTAQRLAEIEEEARKAEGDAAQQAFEQELQAAADQAERLAQVDEEARKEEGDRADEQLQADADRAEREAQAEEELRKREGEAAQEYLDILKELTAEREKLAQTPALEVEPGVVQTQAESIDQLGDAFERLGEAFPEIREGQIEALLADIADISELTGTAEENAAQIELLQNRLRELALGVSLPLALQGRVNAALGRTNPAFASADQGLDDDLKALQDAELERIEAERKAFLKGLEDEQKGLEEGFSLGAGIAGQIIRGALEGGGEGAAQALLSAGQSVAQQISNQLLAAQASSFASAAGANMAGGLGGAISAGLGAVNPVALAVGIGLPLVTGLLSNAFSGQESRRQEQARAEQERASGRNRTISTSTFNITQTIAPSFSGDFTSPAARDFVRQLARQVATEIYDQRSRIEGNP